jgi:sialate O-acetylesterase
MPDYAYDFKRTPPEKATWTKLTVPNTWESQGFEEHDGSAWYKKQFTIPKDLQGEDLVLLLGKIDDFDQTYFNGKVIGSTNAYDKLRVYYIPSELVNAGAMNLLLVFVDDPQGLGGIYEGPVGVMKQTDFTRYLRWKK